MMNDFSLPITDSNQVPVFDCHVILSPPDENQKLFRAVVSNLPEVTAEGASERDCLHKIVSQFKSAIQSYHANDVQIPWASTKIERKPGQQERWIPVHL